ncbi:MAG: helix-turn-helix transcriptional regulator [Leptolyngbyaceae cyanobacterium]
MLTEKETAAIMERCYDNSSVVSYGEKPKNCYNVQQKLEHEYAQALKLRPGLWLQIIDIHKCSNHIQHIQHSENMPMILSFYLSGGSKISNNSLEPIKEKVAGKNHLYCAPNTTEIEEFSAGQRIHTIKIYIFPKLFSTFRDRLQELPTDIKNAVAHPEQSLLNHTNQITPAQQHVLQQLLLWPYKGITRHFYMESKVLELLALYFDQLLEKPKLQSKKLTSKEIDSVYQARDILIQTMTNPPSLPELAKQVQLNERKLKQGFREIFDNTVFGYLREHRMKQAQMLLQTGKLNIQETAHWVGYASRSSFIAAFKKKFQVTPSQYSVSRSNKVLQKVDTP